MIKRDQIGEIEVNALGRRVFGLAAILLGLIGFWWGDFATVWQPVPAGVPGRTLLAYLAAGLLLSAGLAIQWQRFARPASLALATLYAFFALLWAGRLVNHPLNVAIWLGLAEEFALVVGALVAFEILECERIGSNPLRAGRMLVGACLVIFGISHLVYVPQTASMVPQWLPPGTIFWAILTGGAQLAAGLALISGKLAPLAARLVTVMFIGFGALVWLPRLFIDPSQHMTWGGNGVNLALVGAIWIIADALADVKSRSES